MKNFANMGKVIPIERERETAGYSYLYNIIVPILFRYFRAAVFIIFVCILIAIVSITLNFIQNK